MTMKDETPRAATEHRIPSVTAGTLQVAAGVTIAALLAAGPVLGSWAVGVLTGIAAAVLATQGIATLTWPGRPKHDWMTVTAIVADGAVVLAAMVVLGMHWRQTTLAGGILGLGVIVAVSISALAIAMASTLE
ncbi:hypothetical protein GPX89_35900 [Nocardia sp. ET3-3]|uniref:Uncharacterized protein n=1 Tax=Nocardia terrae TaxID=2675851 RepID=A0A7K1V7H7_9NOCA|nr:hypothetical protein [Nocardia terrae]MVU82603.1 hypothetical protein [Nocardia terrae]